MTDDYEALEQQLDSAARSLEDKEKPLDLSPVIRRANQELAFRDAVNFGFARLLTTVLTLFSGVHRYFNQPKKEQSKDG